MPETVLELFNDIFSSWICDLEPVLMIISETDQDKSLDLLIISVLTLVSLLDWRESENHWSSGAVLPCVVILTLSTLISPTHHQSPLIWTHLLSFRRWIKCSRVGWSGQHEILHEISPLREFQLHPFIASQLILHFSAQKFDLSPEFGSMRLLGRGGQVAWCTWVRVSRAGPGWCNRLVTELQVMPIHTFTWCPNKTMLDQNDNVWLETNDKDWILKLLFVDTRDHCVWCWCV